MFWQNKKMERLQRSQSVVYFQIGASRGHLWVWLHCNVYSKTIFWVWFYFNSLVKLPIFSACFILLYNCVYKKQKKSIKYRRNFCSKTFFKVFANSGSAHSKIWCSRFSYEQNDIIFFIPPVGDLPEIKEFLYLTTTMEWNSFQI